MTKHVKNLLGGNWFRSYDNFNIRWRRSLDLLNLRWYQLASSEKEAVDPKHSHNSQTYPLPER